MKKDYLEALMEALIVGAVVLLILTGSLLAMEMDKRIESSAQRSYVFSTYLKDDAIRIHSQEGVATLTGTVLE
jgi:hyperosmotically inducible protein